MKKASLIQANRRQRGFTLIELMISIAILAILLTIAVPSFTNVINNNRTVTATNNLVTALTLARSEATKRGLPVVACSSNTNQTGCRTASSTNWGNGWIVFVDDVTTNGSRDATETIVQAWPAPSGGISVTSPTAANVSYRSSGQLSSAALSFNILKSGCTGNNQRTLTINAIGRTQVASTACP